MTNYFILNILRFFHENYDINQYGKSKENILKSIISKESKDSLKHDRPSFKPVI